MEFFDKKEEVYEFNLTEYGKYLLSVGKLKPAYYAFFDDDILYDVSGSNYSESQNETQVRIQSETPKMKATTTRTSAETRVTQFLNNLEGPIGSGNSDPANKTSYFRQPIFEDKGKVNAHPLGNSSVDTQYNPAWQVGVLSTPEISSSQDYTATHDYVENIPQLNINIDYETYFKPGEMTDNSLTGYLENLNGETTNIFLALKEDYLMLEVIEENTDFEKENFDIEIYHSSSIGSGSYVQLSYVPDSEIDFVFPKQINNNLNVPGNVEYYMNVLVDTEIPREIIEQLNISERALQTSAERLKLNRDLYTRAEVQIGEDGEPC